MNLLTQTTIINYSIIMRSVNANLLAINQAKKEGKTIIDLNAPTTPEEGDDGTSGGGSATGGSENTGGSNVGRGLIWLKAVIYGDRGGG